MVAIAARKNAAHRQVIKAGRLPGWSDAHKPLPAISTGVRSEVRRPQPSFLTALLRALSALSV